MARGQITVRQVKAARALLGWSQTDLANESGVSEPTIARLESADGEMGGRPLTTSKVRRALEAGGRLPKGARIEHLFAEQCDIIPLTLCIFGLPIVIR